MRKLSVLLLVALLARACVGGQTGSATSDSQVKLSGSGENCTKSGDCIGDLVCIEFKCSEPARSADGASVDVSHADSVVADAGVEPEALGGSDVNPAPDSSTWLSDGGGAEARGSASQDLLVGSASDADIDAGVGQAETSDGITDVGTEQAAADGDDSMSSAPNDVDGEGVNTIDADGEGEGDGGDASEGVDATGGLDGTCLGSCGGMGLGGCWCDAKCSEEGDCCPDVCMCAVNCGKGEPCIFDFSCLPWLTCGPDGFCTSK